MKFQDIAILLSTVSLAVSAGAQTKIGGVEKPNQSGYFPPPPGTSSLVLVGGSDDCANAATADAISGTGLFAVNTTGATTGTQQGTGCATRNNDVWFYWTAPMTGTAFVETCTLVTVDSVVATWADDGAGGAGTCPTTRLACNDDACALQSRLTFAVTAGTNYFVQLGAFGTTTTYSGQFRIDYLPPPPSNDDCNTPIAIAGSGAFPYDTTSATTGTEGQGEPLCLSFGTTAIQKDLWYTWTPTQTGTVTLTTCGGFTGGNSTDTKAAVYLGTGCPTAAALACNDDDAACTAAALATTLTFTATCGQTYTIQLGSFSVAASITGTFSITEAGTACSSASTPYCFGDGSGTPCPCGNNSPVGNNEGCLHSFGIGGKLVTSGSSSISNDTLVLQGSQMPNASALYFQGTTQAGAGLGTVFGDGLRCAAGTVIRLGTKTNMAGMSQYPTGADLPVSVRGQVSVPGTRTYQVWFRNAAAFCTPFAFNLTNGVLVAWTP